MIMSSKLSIYINWSIWQNYAWDINGSVLFDKIKYKITVNLYSFEVKKLYLKRCIW
jgi:hypothetical protein